MNRKNKRLRQGARRTAEWIDITIPIKSGMVHWPGDPSVRIKRKLDMNRGGKCNVSFLSMGSHAGTHMDPPLHFIHSGTSLDRMPLQISIGPARVIRIRNPKQVTADELRLHQIQPGERILFKTRNSERVWKTDSFIKDFVFISEEAAKYLALKKICLVGIDYLSVGGFFENGDRIHQILLRSGVWILEGINLSSVREGKYELVCLPLKIQNSDGAPSRALLRALE